MDVATWCISPIDAQRDQAIAAGALLAVGAQPGDRVVVALDSSPVMLALVLGALRIGVVPVPVSPLLSAAELNHLIGDAEPLLAFTDTAMLRAFMDGAPMAEVAPVPRTRPMHYTSGTSGRPKGVWAGVLSDQEAAAMHDDEGEAWHFSADDVLLLSSPMHHSAPLRFAAGTLLRGGSVVLLSRFDGAAVADAIDRYRPTTAFMAPSHMQRLFAGEQRKPDLRSFRLVAHAGEPCPASLKERALEAFPDGSVWEFYGATEGQFTICSPAEWRARPGTVGRARPHRQLSVDESGQIWCEAPPWARFEYWNDAAKTRNAWRGNAFTVGDLGRIDPDGYLFLDGRRDDLVISGGVNVYPAEVEAALAGIEGVESIVVFGAPDERWGARVCAAVVGSVTVAALEEAARESLAPFKRPRQYVHVGDADIPRTSTGKVRRSTMASTFGIV
jgi:long-chain acyl-CoA synthetase